MGPTKIQYTKNLKTICLFRNYLIKIIFIMLKFILPDVFFSEMKRGKNLRQDFQLNVYYFLDVGSCTEAPPFSRILRKELSTVFGF